MPRRLRLVFQDGQATGVVQKPYGTNYTAWNHPLTPYWRQKEDSPEWLPAHPKAGRLSYRNWLGISLGTTGGGKGTRRAARTVRACRDRYGCPDFELMAGGWAMDNMKPVNFALDRYPGFPGLNDDDEDRVFKLVAAANIASGALRRALKDACQLAGSSGDAMVEAFFAETEEEFTTSVRGIIDGADTEVETKWHKTLSSQAFRMFEERALGSLTDHDIAGIEKRVVARRRLLGVLAWRVRKELGSAGARWEGETGMREERNIGRAVLEWYRSALEGDHGDARTARARLRRCESPSEALRLPRRTTSTDS